MSWGPIYGTPKAEVSLLISSYVRSKSHTGVQEFPWMSLMSAYAEGSIGCAGRMRGSERLLVSFPLARSLPGIADRTT